LPFLSFLFLFFGGSSQFPTQMLDPWWVLTQEHYSATANVGPAEWTSECRQLSFLVISGRMKRKKRVVSNSDRARARSSLGRSVHTGRDTRLQFWSVIGPDHARQSASAWATIPILHLN
jgi:hypothetical protein